MPIRCVVIGIQRQQLAHCRRLSHGVFKLVGRQIEPIDLATDAEDFDQQYARRTRLVIHGFEKNPQPGAGGGVRVARRAIDCRDDFFFEPLHERSIDLGEKRFAVSKRLIEVAFGQPGLATKRLDRRAAKTLAAIDRDARIDELRASFATAFVETATAIRPPVRAGAG